MIIGIFALIAAKAAKVTNLTKAHHKLLMSGSLKDLGERNLRSISTPFISHHRGAL